jgi:hypothetical protein
VAIVQAIILITLARIHLIIYVGNILDPQPAYEYMEKKRNGRYRAAK